jgi:hypothetical protein
VELTEHSGRVPSLGCSILRGVSKRLVDMTGLIGAQQFHQSQYNGPDEILNFHYTAMHFGSSRKKNVSRFRNIITECSYTKCEDFLLIGSNTESLGDQNQMFGGKEVSKLSNGLGNFET